MPGNGAKRKAPKPKGRAFTSEATASSSKGTGQTPAPASPSRCETLEADEMTHCRQPAVYDRRCGVHAKQYRVMYLKYKEAAQTVDQIKSNKNIPTQDQIGVLDMSELSETITWLSQYLVAIFVERAGRGIHSKRFFLKTLEKGITKSFSELQLGKNPDIHTSNVEDDSDDLIEAEMQGLKTQILRPIQIIWDPEVQKTYMFEAIAKLNVGVTIDAANAKMIRDNLDVHHRMNIQFARRIIWHDLSLCHKVLDKVSFRDLVLSKDFDLKDMLRFSELFFKDRHGFRLVWPKDTLVEALAMLKLGPGSASVGKATNVENRLVRLCNSYNDVIGFLSFTVFGMIPPLSFCRFEDPAQDAISHAARQHLSLSGDIVADMRTRSITIPSPFPNTRMRAKKPGCIVWSDIEIRSHIFRAFRNECDRFTNAFLGKLRARPDIFQVVTRSETDPTGAVDSFGDGPNAALPYIRTRMVEAPLTHRDTAERGPWKVEISAIDRLYGTGQPPGYLTEINRRTWKKREIALLRFLNFPVKYFVILDAVPGRHVPVLARHIAWAAFRAKGYAQGECDARKYALASNMLFEKYTKAREHLS
ncbi:hypothetical protein DXG01_014712 [Tephrocybe rancida]|nr:hypothetical protein DXG01_014712 [Tephrocybe rancida]